MKQRRKIFNVKYRFNYKSGKSWTESKEVYAISSNAAIDIIKWLYCSRDLDIISCDWMGNFVGIPITPSRQVLGDY